MSWTTQVRRYIALKAFQARQACTNFKEDALALRQYWSFRNCMRISKGWPLRVLANLRSRSLENSHGFGKFDGKRDGLSLLADHTIFDATNAPLFSKKGAPGAFEYTNMAGIDDTSPADAAEQNEAEEMIRVQAQLADAIKAMQADEVRRRMRWKTVAGVVVLAIFALAVLLFVG